MSRRNHSRDLTLALALMLPALGGAAETLNDPMRPPGKEAVTGARTTRQTVDARYRLDSVIIAPNRRQAIINGKRVAQGEMVNGAKLLEVQATQVTLLVGGKRHVLRLLPLNIKMPSEAPRQ